MTGFKLFLNHKLSFHSFCQKEKPFSRKRTTRICVFAKQKLQESSPFLLFDKCDKVKKHVKGLTYTNSPNFRRVWISAHDLWSATATARLRRGEGTIAPDFCVESETSSPRIMGLDPLLLDAICLPPPIILLQKIQPTKRLISFVFFQIFNLISRQIFLMKRTRVN